MFFAIDLLLPQHGGRFSLAWISATRGIRYVNKKEIINCNVIDLCDEILQMVMSSSSRPRMRLSLSLASRLINGVVKIYRAQVCAAHDDIMQFLVQVRRPIIVASPSSQMDQDSEPTPVVRVTRKRKRKIILTPPEPALDVLNLDIVLDEAALERPGPSQIDPELITLREEIPRRSIMEHGFEGIGDLGIIEDTEPPALPEFLMRQPALIVQRLEEPMPNLDPSRIPTSREDEIEIAPPLTPEKTVAKESETPSKRRRLTEIQAETPMEIPAEAAPQVQTEVERPFEIALPEPQPIPIRRRRGQPAFNKLRLRLVTRRVVNINRCLPNEKILFNVEAYDDFAKIAMPRQLRDGSYIHFIMDVFRKENEDPVQFLSGLRSAFRSMSTSSSRSASRRRMSSSGVHLGIEVPRAPLLSGSRFPPLPPLVEEQVAAPTPLKKPKKAAEGPKEDTPATAVAEIIPFEVDVQPQMLPSDLPIEVIAAPPAAEAAKEPQAQMVVDDIALLSDIEKEERMQMRILKVVTKWDFQIQGHLAIEDVCPPPINRRNIAVTFNSLLSMHKRGYVKLNNKPDSIELGSIKKGEHFRKKR